MAKFLSGEDLNNAVYDIIYNARKTLLIVSPYIRLDPYFREELFKKHKGNADLHLIIAFGKNPSDIERSFKFEDFEYFKDFPSISIIYIPNLHAKYYANDDIGIITSINLYDYSFKNNIEFGVQFEAGFLGHEKVDKVAWRTALDIIEDNYTVFIRIPNFKKKLLGKDYIGSETKYDVIQDLVEKGVVPKKSILDFEHEVISKAYNHSGPRISREEFEENSNESSSNNGMAVEVIEKRDGYCVFCGLRIKLNPRKSYCQICYESKQEISNSTTLLYCHICGKEHKNVLKFPAHRTCYHNTKGELNY